jgi:hypothetical protein
MEGLVAALVELVSNVEVSVLPERDRRRQVVRLVAGGLGGMGARHADARRRGGERQRRNAEARPRKRST